MAEAVPNVQVARLRGLITALKQFTAEMDHSDEPVPSEVRRVILIIQGRIYDIEEEAKSNGDEINDREIPVERETRR